MERALIEYIANALWQIPLLAACAWSLLRVMKAGPATQHYLWLAVLALAVLLPARGIGTDAAMELPPVGDRVSSGFASGMDESALLDRSGQTAKIAALHFPARVGNVRLSAMAAHAIVGIYVAGVLLGLVRLGYGWHGARQLVRQSREISWTPEEAPKAMPETTLRRTMDSLARIAVGTNAKLPQIRESGDVSSPAVVGAMAPVLLLPVDFARHSDDQITAALCHELAHVRRRDYLVNMVCQIAALPVSWHPVTGVVQRSIGRSREMICDSIAARQMCSESSYAKCLLALAQSMVGGRELAERAQALGLFSNGKTLEERVMRLMERKSVMSLRAKVARVASGVTGMVAAVVIASVFHVTPLVAAPNTGDSPQDAQVQPVQPPVPPQTPAAPEAAKQAQTAPVAPAALAATPAVPAVSAAPATPAKPSAQTLAHREQEAGSTGMTAERQRELAREDQLRMEVQMGALRVQLGEVGTVFKSDEFQKQMAEIQAQVNSAEFRKQMEEVRRQAAEFARKQASLAINKDELKRQMDKVQGDEFKRQQAYFQSEEFKKQIQESTRVAVDAAMNSKLRAEAIKKQMADLQKQLESGEFKQQMEKAMEQFREEQGKDKARQ
jgi:beta-lactamase regulating signal transducer with metallopeptidase domain